jgi:hypothetical protein
MTKTHYLMGICPLYEGMAARISCILDVPLLNRELQSLSGLSSYIPKSQQLRMTVAVLF